MGERVLSGRGIGRRKQCFVEFGKEFGRYGVAVGVGEGLGEVGKLLIVFVLIVGAIYLEGYGGVGVGVGVGVVPEGVEDDVVGGIPVGGEGDGEAGLGAGGGVVVGAREGLGYVVEEEVELVLGCALGDVPA